MAVESDDEAAVSGRYVAREIEFDEMGIGLIGKSGTLNDLTRLRAEMVRLMSEEQKFRNYVNEHAPHWRELYERRNHPYKYAWDHTVYKVCGRLADFVGKLAKIVMPKEGIDHER